jgi:hypothetical protein
MKHTFLVECMAGQRVLSVWPERGEKREEVRKRWEEREGEGNGSHETYLVGESGWPGVVFYLSGLER